MEDEKTEWKSKLTRVKLNGMYKILELRFGPRIPDEGHDMNLLLTLDTFNWLVLDFHVSATSKMWQNHFTQTEKTQTYPLNHLTTKLWKITVSGFGSCKQTARTQNPRIKSENVLNNSES